MESLKATVSNMDDRVSAISDKLSKASAENRDKSRRSGGDAQCKTLRRRRSM